MRHLAIPAALLALALLAACGSSGGGDSTVVVPVQGSPNAHLFAGTYQAIAVSATEDMGAENLQANWGTMLADGVYDVLGTLTRNWGGVIAALATETYGTFAVESDRRFTYESFFAGIDHSIGGITETGDVATLAIMADGATPTFQVYARREGAHDLGSLSGTYRVAGFGATVAGVMTSATWGTVTFDGAGGGTSDTAVNQEGATFGPVLLPITYTVAPDGAMVLTFSGGLTLAGGIAAGGDVLLLGGGTTAGDNMFVYALVREGVGLGDADLDGNFVLTGMTQEVGTNLYATIAGNLAADGMGAAQARGLRCQEGVVEWIPSENVTTTVAPTGALTLTTGGGDVFVGGLVPDARFGVLVGPTNAGSDPTILFLLR